MRRESGSPGYDIADMLPKSKSNPENVDDDLVPYDIGDVDDVDDADGDGEDGPNAVLRRRSEVLGCSGWNLDGDMIWCCSSKFVTSMWFVMVLIR